ncbi:zinc-binding dehydrogenase [Paenibacillus sp. alder61]|uniref:zinc-binding dehydrogenase n=1 Tax=Paenibacillus sp. alder61 TaxID=2862948 RepID=UPI001CD4B3C1|nr:zinc-binding dehydrogenase [Paenibacillus sp. alder61]MCA1295320.1 zinc-binding dehydrogenase [Paenibacillus sp. alder61]
MPEFPTPDLGSLLERNQIRPVIDRVYDFQQTEEALAYLKTGRAKGKVAVKMK